MTGTTYGGRDIVALQVTKDATGSDIPGRPAVLYNAMQHAREWLAGETCRRTLDYFVGHYGKGTSAGKEVTKLVDNTELWFVCVNNPDGYEYTFTPGQPPVAKEPRRQRQQRRDRPSTTASTRTATSRRTGAATTTAARPTRRRRPTAARAPPPSPRRRRWRRSSPRSTRSSRRTTTRRRRSSSTRRASSRTRRAPTTRSSPRWRATRSSPAIPGFIPELSAALYITNGDFTDWAYNTQDTLSFTPEGTPAEDLSVTGFEYPDSPLQIQQEFERHLPFALDLAHSADDPANPHSHLDNTAADFTVDKFKESYGSPQPVGAVVKRELGEVKMQLPASTAKKAKKVSTEDYEGGERYYKEPGVFYHRVRGVVKGTDPGDEVEVWFTAGGEKSKSFTYEAEVEIRQPGADPRRTRTTRACSRIPRPSQGRSTSTTTTDALDAAGVDYDVYDVDAHGRRPPDPLGILGHYSHVVWYTGDDYVPREPDAPGGSGITKARGRHAERRARLLQRRRQALLHGHERRAGVRRGLHLQPVPGRGGHLLPGREPELHHRPGRLPPVLARRLPLRRRRRGSIPPTTRSSRWRAPTGPFDPLDAHVQRAGLGAERRLRLDPPRRRPPCSTPSSSRCSPTQPRRRSGSARSPRRSTRIDGDWFMSAGATTPPTSAS